MNTKEPLSCGRDGAGPLNRFFLWWLNGLMYQAANRSLELTDLPSTPSEDKAKALANCAEIKWNGMKRRHGKDDITTSPSLFKLLVKLYGCLFFEGSLCAFAMGLIRIVQNVLVGQLLSLRSDDSNLAEYAYMIAAGIAVSSIIEAFVIHHWTITCRHAGLKARATCTILLYKKILKWNKSELSQTSTGQIINLFGNDMAVFDERIRFLPCVVIGPIELLANLGVMWWLVGWYAATGIGYLLLYLLIQVGLGRLFSSMRRKANLMTDERIQLMMDVLNGIKLIKMYAWEYPMQKLITAIRKMEMSYISRSIALRAFLAGAVNVTGRLAFFWILLPYVLCGNLLEPRIVFTMTTFCYVLRAVASYLFPSGAVVAVETYVSIKRIDAFLNLHEKKTDKSKKKCWQVDESVAIHVRNLMCTWQQSPMENDDGSVSFVAKPGDIIGVVGSVGSGKTTLLMALLGEISTFNDAVKSYGRIAYVPQESWLISGTILDNIVFGSPVDEERFQKVVEICALAEDLNNFPDGRLTMVGQKGTMMSGGQKARINFARAVYSDADLYLLDDPLSAVDAKVGRHLFEECICKYLKPKIVVLATHQVQFLPQVSSIVVLNKGMCSAYGSYEDLVSSGVHFTHFSGDPNEDDETKQTTTKEESLETVTNHDEIVPFLDGRITETEEMAGAKDFKASGFVSLKVHWEYMTKDSGVFMFISLMVFVVLFQGLGVSVDYYLKYWVDQQSVCKEFLLNMTRFHYEHDSHQLRSSNLTSFHFNEIRDCSGHKHLYVYIALLLLSFVATVVALLIGGFICRNASMGYHSRLLYSVLRAKPYYFDVQPIGNFQNRFSTDMSDIDLSLPISLFDVLVMTGGCVAPMVIVCIQCYWLVIPSVILTVFYCKMCVVHIKACGNFKRLEGIARSPLYSTVTSTILGLPVVHAMQKEDVMLSLFEKHLDCYSSAMYHYICANCWVTSKIQVADALNVVVVVFTMAAFIDTLSSASIGLVMTMTFMLMPLLWWNVIRIGEGEDQLTAVERVKHFINLESEAALESSPDVKPQDLWPEKGNITMQNVTVKYPPGDKVALKDLTFKVNNGEKIGIVGRTGAGKSSLVTSIFRLIEPTGAVCIDGVLVNEIGLHDLRKHISVIPQDPIMFAGDVRRNLDPFGKHTDEQLISVLEDVDMKQAVVAFSSGLDTNVQEGGSLFSVGQRQLICIARAILRNNKILLLDEATANIDNKMDDFIQKTIRRKFKDCTVLTVAHRLSTIMDYDRVMVLHKGEMMEFDEPHTLLQNKDGHFHQLVKCSGSKSEAALHNIAKAAQELRRRNC